MTYKKILFGINTFSNDWLVYITKINKDNIIIYDFSNKYIHHIIISKKIDYIIPLSKKDFIIITRYKKYNNLILYPNIDIVNILNNKLLFTKFMLKHFYDFIPITYYLDNIKLLDIEYPIISKPIYSTNGNNMKIYHNENEFSDCCNKIIIQKFIKDLNEFSAYMLCINGKIINWKIIKFKYEEFTIKKGNFPDNYESVENINLYFFEQIIIKLNYTGGICFDFKFDFSLNKIDIFEINPRFGGSAFTLGFIYDLLCIKIY
jgi:carbamoylphosphate synthase large subunit